MGLTEKLDQLMEQRGINRKALSAESGIPYTTLMSLYDKGYENIKLSTLRALARYFNVTMDYLADDNATITVVDGSDEAAFLELFRNAPEQLRRAAKRTLKDE